ncbi:MAG: ATP-dependent Clp protease adaptor ClpS [Leptospiraceae bacterium]|nr:ATP-dependent Clp protease adaptor ClpS [Leptospiraceae bacterium]MCK6382293.1 ATP-dependent Clp protease adaptor ClpS [Leptospiraceae bacterium]NUM41194.1 ATP-dependent Clp protease adaptor ClpS [Leptospiraceae bacterium]
MAPITEEITESQIKYSTDDIYGNKVILYNDEFNSFDHVEDCLIKICFKNKREAKKIAMEAHTKGKAICYKGSLEECETVAEKMGKEKLTVSLE